MPLNYACKGGANLGWIMFGRCRSRAEFEVPVMLLVLRVVNASKWRYAAPRSAVPADGTRSGDRLAQSISSASAMP